MAAKIYSREQRKARWRVAENLAFDKMSSWADLNGYARERRVVRTALQGFHGALLCGGRPEVMHTFCRLASGQMPDLPGSKRPPFSLVDENATAALDEMAQAHQGVFYARNVDLWTTESLAMLTKCMLEGLADGQPAFSVVLCTAGPKMSTVTAKKLFPLALACDVIVNLDIVVDVAARITPGRDSKAARTMLGKAWQFQLDRQRNYNSAIEYDELFNCAQPFDHESRKMLEMYKQKAGTVMHEKKLRLMRTIADSRYLRGVTEPNMLEADMYLTPTRALRDLLVTAGEGSGWDQELLSGHKDSRTGYVHGEKTAKFRLGPKELTEFQKRQGELDSKGQLLNRAAGEITREEYRSGKY